MTQYWPFSGLIRQATTRERLIVSLDFGDHRAALTLVDRLAHLVGMFKVGRALCISGGPEFIREIRRRGAEVFLDLKFHDSPQRVFRAAVEATRLGVKMFDLHAYGSACGSNDLMMRTRIEVARVCRVEGLRRPSILAVAMLAGLKPVDSSSRIPDAACCDHVAQIARHAATAELDGVVTTPHEVASVRNACGRRFIIVTSGVRLGESAYGSPHMISAPTAIRAGADYIVIGSAIWRASEPVRAIREIACDLERGLRINPRPAIELFGGRPV